MTKRIISLITLVLLCFTFATAYAEHTEDSSYIYDFWGSANQSLNAFELSTVLNSESIDGVTLKSVDDVYVYGGRIFIADAQSNAVIVLDENYELLNQIKIIRDTDGKIVVDESNNKQAILNGPKGVFANDRNLYIADTGNNRIFVLDINAVDEEGNNTYPMSMVVNKPENMVGSTEFVPSKIAVDNADRIFVVAENSTEGIIELNPDGSFSRYYGVNSPTVSLVDFFWRSIASAEQRAQMSKIYAPAFSNIQTDSDGFVYAVTTDTASTEMAFRFNAKGENVLRKFGYSETLGDLPTSRTDTSKSTFIDVAVSDYGVYALLDTSMNRVFLYNFDGNLLSVFGGKGNTKGKLNTPSSICWMGQSLIVGDSRLACAFVFTPTDFGKLVLEAEKMYFNGDFDGAAVLNEQIVSMNANYDHAYVSIGKNRLMQDNYEEAMHYFKLGNDKTYYSTAFAGYRNLLIQKYFIIFAVVFLAFVVWVLWTEVAHNRKQKKLEEL